jgi:hypothetical protein
LSIDLKAVLAGLPTALRDTLIANYREIASNFAAHRWEPSELNGGKFCETCYSILSGALSGSFPAKATKPANMLAACQALEKTPQDPARVGDRSLRILVPRMLVALYEIRNNRGVGHVGGDVDPNLLDATVVYSVASWVLAELVRIFHGVTTEEARETGAALVERKAPLIWEVETAKRVLDPKLSKTDQTLLLLHQSIGWVSDKDLMNWVEYSSLAMFRKRVLGPLHSSRLIEFDTKAGRAHLSPLGIEDVEKRLLASVP